MKRLLSILCLLSVFAVVSADYVPRDYAWTSQSRNSSESMPCGGHDIGMNVWVENGDVLFYIQQSGWFDENNTLLKAGRWRLHFDGKPFDGKDFEQRLSLDEGAIYIKGSGTEVRIWADVFSPIVFVTMASTHTERATLSYESWRYKDRPVTKAECQQCSYKWILPKDCTTFADSIKADGDKLTFSHKNREQTVFDFTVSYEHLDAIKESLYNPIGGLEMRGVMYAPDFHFAGTTTNIYASTDYQAWNYSCDNLRTSCVMIDLRYLNHKLYEDTVVDGCGTVAPYAFPTLKTSDSRKRSAQWWHNYWQRSWIESDTQNDSLQTMLRNYELMRYMLGCNAYGQWPTKFNGGLFTFDPVYVDSTATFTPDYRKWGGGTMTAQNQRLVYWPMVKSGDYDLLSSQLDTYLRLLPNAIARTRHYWGHGGASFTEQLENFGLPNPAEYGKHKEGDDLGVEKNKWLEYEWDTALEFCQMYKQILPWYPDSTLDKYHELVEEALRFFSEHYPNLVIYPGSGCETYKMARNPASTVAALQAMKHSLNNIGVDISLIPNIPLQVIDGDTCIAPAESWERIQNTETPQLYPVFPWRIYGVGRPHLNIARNTYFKDPHALEMRSTKGWKQDNIWAACLGLTDEARRLNTEKLSNGPYRFPAFWDAGFDWAPDHNRGGAGMIGLQEMLLQEYLDHNPILFPAWPREWNCRFRFYISGQRRVDGEIKDGKITFSIDGVESSDEMDDEIKPQWIGAITRQDAHLPKGRNYTDAKLKEPLVKEAWKKVDTLSRRSILLRKDFNLKEKVLKATVSIVGLGFYELTINGRKVGDASFAPLWSDYDKSIFYNTYDVTSLLKSQTSGLQSQIIQVLLGNGFYNEHGLRYAKMKISFGPPTLLFRMHIEYLNGNTEDIVSDDQWKWALSPVTFNSIYGGEDYDARLEHPEEWFPVVIQEVPKGVLRQQIAKPVKIMERYSVKDTVRNDSVLVLDMGQNLAGFPEITVQGKQGQQLKLTPGETLTKEGLVNQKQTGRPHYYTYILKGENQQLEIWHPRFSYYGYRYLQIEGDIEVLKNIESCFIYNSAEKTGDFECSNPLFNDAYRLIDRAIRSNWQSVWTDCPHREKLGWLEQDWLNGEGLLANYDCRAMIEQTMQNIADAQYPNGALPEIAPNYAIFEGSWAAPFLESPEWGGAFIALPFLYQAFYGDEKLVTRYRPQMKRYVDYLATQDSCYILRQGLGDWYDYGPGRAGFAKNTPMALVSTAHYYWWNHLMGEARADSIKTAFIKEFYHPTTHQYATGSQCAQAIALEMDLVPKGDREAVLQQLINDIHAHGDRLTTGDVGNRYLFNALIHNGQQELLYKMLNHYDVPGYGYQIKLGYTTLTEQWNPEFGASMNHFMMGHLNNLLIPYFLGIWHEGEQITIAPHPVGDLTWCRGQMADIKVDWHLEGNIFVLNVDIPAHRSASIRLPYSGQTRVVGEGKHTLRENSSAGEIIVNEQGNIHEALRKAREWRRTNDPRCKGGITITLQEGRYYMNEPLFLRPEDSGTKESPLIIRGSGKHKSVICGDPRQKHTQIWPKQGMERMIAFDMKTRTITIPAFDSLWLPPPNLEMVVHQRWAIAILRVKMARQNDSTIVVSFKDPESRLEFEHPWPQPVIGSEKGNSSFLLRTTVQRDRIEQLVVVDGANYVTFEGVAFENTGWNRPLHKGHVTLQGGFPLVDAYKLKENVGLPWDKDLENQAWIERPVSAVSVRNAQHVDFKNCLFQHLGVTALDYVDNISDCTVSACSFEDIGGTAIMGGSFAESPREVHRPYTDLAERCQRLTIDKNLIHNISTEDWGAVAISLGYVRDCTISNNWLDKMNYSGICVGWGWTPHDTGMRNNHIINNKVSDYARQLYDAGGIYTLSYQPGSSIKGNIISAPAAAPYATNDRAFCIYLDARTDGFTIENNTTEGRPIRRDEIGDNHPGPNIIFKQ